MVFLFDLFTINLLYAILIIEGDKMIIGMSFIICTLIFTVMISINYFAKKHVNTIETKLYNYILVFSLINLVTEFMLCTNILLKIELLSFYNLLINKFFLVVLFTWFSLFTIYIVSVSNFLKATKRNYVMFII